MFIEINKTIIDMKEVCKIDVQDCLSIGKFCDVFFINICQRNGNISAFDFSEKNDRDRLYNKLKEMINPIHINAKNLLTELKTEQGI